MIDVWDFATFDDALVATLRDGANEIRSYLATSREIQRRHESGDPTAIHARNPYANEYSELLNHLSCMMLQRTIRAWHYTRLTGSEVERITKLGLVPSTLETAKERLQVQVDDGEIASEVAKSLLLKSPLQKPDQYEARSNKFWMTSHPLNTTEHEVEPLLRYWGGEVVYFFALEDPRLEKIVSQIGKSRVLEVGVPLNATTRVSLASQSVVATFARTLGCVPDFDNFDLYTVRPLDATAILDIHTEGDAFFSRIGDGYPTNFRPRHERRGTGDRRWV